jgi:hypothetical protein
MTNGLAILGGWVLLVALLGILAVMVIQGGQAERSESASSFGGPTESEQSAEHPNPEG